jgi:exonuclease SbcD
MRILHTADWHIGRHTHGSFSGETGMNSRTYELERSLYHLVTEARALKPRVIVITGDLIESSDLTTEELDLLIRTLEDLAEVAYVIIVLGNHDLESHAARASLVTVVASRIDNVDVWQEAGHVDVDDVRFICLPYPHRAQVAARGLSLGDAAKMLEVYVATEAQKAERVVCLGHFTLGGSRYSEQAQPLLGTTMDFVVSPQVFELPSIECALMGHIHGRQVLGKATYAGSLMPLTFGETGGHGFTVVELMGPGAPAVGTDMHNPQAPQMLTVRVADGAPDIMTVGAGTYVRLKSDRRLTDAERKELTALFTSQEARVRGIIEPPEHEVREETRAVAAAQTQDDIVRAYCRAHGIGEAEQLIALMREADSAK